MGKLKHLGMSLLLATTFFSCGDDYDDTALRNDVNDLKSRVEKLESWCSTTNTQISALQGLVSALEQNDYVTGVTPIVEGSVEVGYTITFTKSKPITIYHGKDGKNGADGINGVDGITPLIGAEKDTDGIYYWTIKLGDADSAWLTDVDNNKIPTTGKDGENGNDGEPGNNGEPGKDGEPGHSPVISVDTFEGKLYWKVDDEWLLDSNSNKVAATGEKGDTGSAGKDGEKGPQGEQGDSVFKKDGVKIEDGKVIFTLANGKEFTLPMLVDGLAVGIGGSDLFYASPSDNSIDVTFASTMKEEDYKSIVATITNGNEADWIIKSRGAVDTWKVAVTEPTFTGTDGTYTLGSAKITITPPANVKLSDTALLTVTVTDANDGTISVSREVKYFDGEIVACTGGDLSIKGLDTSVKRLALKGSITVEDFKYIRESLTALEVLDISMTDLTELPDRALRFGGDTPNTSLKAVRLPLSMKTIGYAAFTNCRALTSIDTENVEIIGEWAFEQCRGLVEVKLHDGLKEIRRQAFNNCISLTSIDIPGSVTDLGKNTEVSTSQYEGWVFENCTNLSTITLHEGLKKLYVSTFSRCGVVSINIPTTVTDIPDYAFQECQNLERVTWHNGITQIGEAAFLRCRSLKAITIPTGVTVLRNNLFDECANLQYVTLHHNITEIQVRAFSYCTLLKSEFFPYEDAYIDRAALPNALQTLGAGVFTDCKNMESINMQRTQVKNILRNTYSGCSGITTFYYPNVVETIGEFAFSGCSALVGSFFPASLTSIETNAFHLCTKMSQVYCLGSTPPTLGTAAFDSSLKSISTLFVPEAAISAYSSSSWNPYFKEIKKDLLHP